MRKPDRFDRVVRKEFHKWVIGVPHFSAELVAISLLRLEHRAVVRLVQKARHTGKVRTAYQSNREAKCAVISAYTLACDDLLAALARRRK